MLTKRTILDQIEVTQAGNIQMRFCKQIVEDGKVIASEYHRTAVEVGGDIDTQMAYVNAHLVKMGCEPVTEWQRVRDVATATWTPACRAAWVAAKAAAKDQG